ncbi:stage II sporulation protein M [Brachybacterium sp. EF45031]|uniref:stage II sporulation protein M n=1 Tax=Brachybacterium sillae TaxID=2810536 RepID=UPI00217CF970|nr:stage II sporulation protein M [Brachybacterium sillae]MCS6711018.1 stage II sporulation protein M [Brachybacterium sillae]
METDALTAVHSGTWSRLETLVARRRLDADEVEEMIRLYRRTAAHLSTIRSTDPDPQLVARLSHLVARARWRITGARAPMWRSVVRFVGTDLPAALWSARWSALVAAAVLTVSALVVGTWIALDDTARDTLISQAQQRRLAQHDFVAYYSQGEPGSFAAYVFSNNAWIAVQSVVLGVTGVWPLWMLLQNGVNVGLMGGVLASQGQLPTFFTFILPHGLVELTALVVGSGAGLRVFWALLRPGPLPRLQAVAERARAMVTVTVGLVPVLLIAGILEAFVTPSGLPAALRVLIGALVWALLVTLAVVRGRRVHAEGVTGDLSEEFAGDRVAVAA